MINKYSRKKYLRGERGINTLLTKDDRSYTLKVTPFFLDEKIESIKGDEAKEKSYRSYESEFDGKQFIIDKVEGNLVVFSIEGELSARRTTLYFNNGIYRECRQNLIVEVKTASKKDWYFIRPKNPTKTDEEKAIQNQMPAKLVEDTLLRKTFTLKDGSEYVLNKTLWTDVDGNEMILRPYVGELEGITEYSPEQRQSIIGDAMIRSGYGTEGLKVISGMSSRHERRRKEEFVRFTNDEQIIRYLKKHTLDSLSLEELIGYLENHPVVYVYITNPNPQIRNSNLRYRYLGRDDESPDIIVFEPLFHRIINHNLRCYLRNGVLTSGIDGPPILLQTPEEYVRTIKNGFELKWFFSDHPVVHLSSEDPRLELRDDRLYRFVGDADGEDAILPFEDTQTGERISFLENRGRLFSVGSNSPILIETPQSRIRREGNSAAAAGSDTIAGGKSRRNKTLRKRKKPNSYLV